MSDNRSLVSAPPPAAQITPATGFDPNNVPPEIMQLAVALWASVKDKQGNNALSQADALAAAVHAQGTGEVFGRDSYIGTEGKVKGKIMEGYRAVQNRVETPYQVKYRPLTGQEATDHEVMPGMRCLICDVYVLDVWRRAQKMNVSYEPVHGLGVVLAGEMRWPDGNPKDAPQGKTWRWVLEKRARKDALRQLPPWAKDAFDWQDDDDAEDNATTRQIDDAQFRARVQQETSAQLSPAEQAQKLTASVTAMRGPQSDDPLGIETKRTIGAEERAGDVATDAEFTSLPAAPQSATAAVPTCPVCAGPMWDNRAKVVAAGKKPGPTWSCKAGKFADGVQTGCDGKYWPGEWPPRVKPDAATVDAITALSKALYGPATASTMKTWLADAYQITDAKGVKDGIEHLTPEQAAEMLASLQAEQAKVGPQAAA